MIQRLFIVSGEEANLTVELLTWKPNGHDASNARHKSLTDLIASGRPCRETSRVGFQFEEETKEIIRRDTFIFQNMDNAYERR